MKTCLIKCTLPALLLVVSHFACSQPLNKDQLAFIQKNSATISREEGMPEWKALSGELKDKRLILIGEFNHGSGEIFQLRTSLIRHLHKTLGVNVTLFESGMGELILADADKQTMTAAQMTNGLFAGWRTAEFVELMDYVKTENLSIAGFDVQRSGGSFRFLLKEVADRNKVDSLYYHNLEQRYGVLMQELTGKNAVYDSLRPKTQKLINDYRSLQDILQRNSKGSSKELLLTIATLRNRTRYLSYMLAFLKDRDFHKRWAARDSAMAENVQWLVEHVYKNERVVIIGHNFHVAHYNKKETVMGELLYREYGKEMYSLGVFAGSGSYHDNGGVERKILPPDSAALDIKHIIQSLNGTVNYIPIPRTKSPGSEWLYQDIIVNDTFIDLDNSNKLNLSKSFDGLLLLKSVSPPKK